MENPFKAQSKVNPQRATRAAPGNYDRRINNDVWHALMRAGLSGGEYQMVMTVIDRTWGYGKLSAPISLKKYEEATCLTRQGIVKALKRVEERHIIVCHRNGTRETEYLFNKHYDTWIMPAGKPAFTSGGEEPQGSDGDELDNGSLLAAGEPVLTSPEEPLDNGGSPDKSTRVHQSSEPELTSASKLAEPATEPVSDNNIETSIDNFIESDKILAEIARYYEENLGPIRPMLSEDFKNFCAGYTGPLSWIKEAFMEAVRRNKKSWQYVRTILEGWEERGGPDDKSRPARTASLRVAPHQRGDRAPSPEQYRESLERRGRRR